MDFIALLTAFGFGSITTAFVQSWLSKKSQNDERRFREKQMAYTGLLEAYHRAAVERTDEAAKHFAYWQMRCELVAPEPVRKSIQEIVDTNDNPTARAKAHEELKSAFRLDLGIEK